MKLHNTMKYDIIKMRDQRDIYGLIKILRDKDESDNIRKKAAESLGYTGNKRATKPLIKFLKENNDIQSAAAEALGQIRDKRAVKHLIDALKIGHWYFQIRVIRSLGQIGDKRAIEPLINALKDDYFLIRKKAAEALGQIGEPAVVPLLMALKDIPDDTAYALGQIGDKRALESLIDLLKDNNEYVRANAAYALGQIGDKRAIDPLIEAFKDNCNHVRVCVAKALGQIGGKKVINFLISTLEDNTAIPVLIEIGEPAILPLIKALNSTLCYKAALTLSNMGKVAVLPLIKASKIKNKDIRSHIAYILGEIRDERAIEPLFKILRSEKKDIYDTASAAYALKEIGEPAVLPLIEALKDKNEYVRGKVAKALGGIGDKRALEPLIECLKDKNSYVRGRSAKALGGIGDKRAIEPLIECLKDKSLYVQEKAARALGQLKDKRAIEPLIEVFKVDDWVTRCQVSIALAHIGKEAVLPLIEALKNENMGVRAFAASTLDDLHWKFENDIQKVLYSSAKEELDKLNEIDF